MIELDQIAKKYGTDKSSEVHNYCVKYEKYLPFNRTDNLKILEIGVLDGQSLKMWKEYYNESTVVGIDINENAKQYEEKRINIEIGSQTDMNFLNEVYLKYKNFDLIIDDGSHFNKDVIYSFEKLFPTLNSGGVYVVEDSCTSYWEYYGGGYLNSQSTIEYFKRLIDDANFMGLHNNANDVNARREDTLIERVKTMLPLCRIDIESICFLNSIILITKR